MDITETGAEGVGVEGAGPGSMTRIYFCDRCNASIPIKDINTNRITIDEGRIYCQACSPRPIRAAGGAPVRWVGPLALVVAVLAMAGVFALAGGLIGERGDRELRGEVRILEGNLSRTSASLATAAAGFAEKFGEMGQKSEGLARDLANIAAELRGLREELAAMEERSKKRSEEAPARVRAELVERFGRRMDEIERRFGALSERNAGLDVQIGGLRERLADLEARPVGVEAGPGRAPAETSPAAPPRELTPEEREIQKWIAQLKDPDVGRRYNAIIELSAFKGQAVFDALLTVLNDPQDYVRVTVVHNLRKVGGPRAIPWLIQSLLDNDEFVKQEALAALKDLTGQDLGTDYKATGARRDAKVKEWEAWWEANKARYLK